MRNCSGNITHADISLDFVIFCAHVKNIIVSHHIVMSGDSLRPVMAGKIEFQGQ